MVSTFLIVSLQISHITPQGAGLLRGAIKKTKKQNETKQTNNNNNNENQTTTVIGSCWQTLKAAAAAAKVRVFELTRRGQGGIHQL